MKEIRLIEILKTFSDDEMKSFEKFLLSPFVKSRRNIGDIFRHLKKFHPEYEQTELTNERIFKALFPDEKYSDKKLKNLIFDLTKASESYLIHSTLDNDETESQMILIKGYFNKKLLEQSMRVIKTIEDKLKPGFSSEKDYLTRIKNLEFLKIYYYSEKGENANIPKSISRYYEASIIQFTIDYISLKCDEEIIRGMIFDDKSKINIVEPLSKSFNVNKFLDSIKDTEYVGASVVNLLYKLLKTAEESDNLNHYFSLKELTFESLPSLDRYEKFILLNYLNNYAVRKINSGDIKFNDEVYLILKKMLEYNAYSISENENMNIAMYRNILHSAITGKEKFSFIEKFIDNYSNKINPEESMGVRDYSYAYLLYYKKDFEKSLELLSRIEHINSELKLDYRLLMLKIYFELNQTEQAFSMIDSFSYYLKKDEGVPNQVKKKYKIFAKYYKEIMKIKSLNAPDELVFIGKEILKENVFPGRPWLIEKLNEYDL